MPRVNRELQRRMAARRERERRRPTERRYTFTTSEPAIEPDDAALVEQDVESGSAGEASSSRAATATASASATRGGVKTAAKPFSAYKDEYAYVYSDLRRVAVVVGGLLVGLLVLYFVLPLLVH
jgi:hypothetical protein